MTRIQLIERDGAPAFVVLPIELWERVRGLVEDAEDAATRKKLAKALNVPIEALVGA